jgi:DNA-binding MarR family transcriptional regulator
MKADRIGALLARAHGAIRARMVAALEGSGLHLGHIGILGALTDGAGRTQKALSAETGIEKSSMVLFLDFLEKGDWVERRPHPTDRRAYLVTLTAEGQRRLHQIGPRLAETQKQAFAALSSEEQVQFAEMLRKLVG